MNTKIRMRLLAFVLTLSALQPRSAVAAVGGNGKVGNAYVRSVRNVWSVWSRGPGVGRRVRSWSWPNSNAWSSSSGAWSGQ